MHAFAKSEIKCRDIRQPCRSRGQNRSGRLLLMPTVSTDSKASNEQAASMIRDDGARSASVDSKADAGRSDRGRVSPSVEPPKEIGGRDGPEPTRFGDWEKGGRCIDF
jgi:hypothetical protein